MISTPPPGLPRPPGLNTNPQSMSIPPPGLGGGTRPPPGFGVGTNVPPQASPVSTTSSGGGGRRGDQDGQGGAATIVRAQIVFLLTTITEESFEKASNEIRTLVSQNGPEMYHHFLRRAAVTANPILQILIHHSQQYQDDPAAPPPNIPTTGGAALIWRLMVSEAIRAARDVTLAPHFALIMLSPFPSTPLPLPSLRLFGLSPSFLFSLAAYTLAAPHVFPPNHASAEVIHTLLRQTYQPAIELLRSPQLPFWSAAVPNQAPYADDLNLQEARTLILALYPRSPSSGGTASRPPTPTNPTSPHQSPLSSLQRQALLHALTVKFSSPAIVLQTLSALSPGGPPRSPGSIPLEDILFELGENLTQDEGTVEAVIGRWWGPWLLDGDRSTGQLVAEAARTVLGLCEGMREGRSVDNHIVVKAMSSLDGVPGYELVRAFDQPRSIAAYPTSLPLLLSLLVVPPQTPVPPLAGLLPASLESPIWNNLSSLLSILNALTSLPPDALPIFTMPNAPPPSAYARIVEPPSPEVSMNKLARQQAKDIQGAGLWNTLGLVQVLVYACGLADAEHVNEDTADIGRRATELLDKAAALAPELVLIALEKIPKPLPASVANMHVRLLAHYLSSTSANVTSSQLVFQQMWQHNPEGLLAVLVEYYSEDENNIGRVADVAFELKILDKLLASDNMHFALDIASLAASKEYFDLEKWLADGVSVKGDEFLQSIFEFVEHKIHLEIEHQHISDPNSPLLYTLGVEVYAMFIRVIRNAEGLTAEDIARFKHLRTDILIVHPRLLNLRPHSKEEQGFVVAKFHKDINDQVDEMYQRMYAGEVKLDDVIEELKRLQESSEQRDQELFACALHSVFDEFKFVKAYPAKELTMTGILFGAIIDARLVKDVPAFVATRYVLDACKAPPSEGLFQFGINALSVLRRSLVDFPGLCRSLLDIPALHDSHPVLINDIVAALAEREELDMQGGVKLAFPALRLPILVEEGYDEFREPDAKKKDAIMFVINQIAPSNYEAKSKEMAKLFEDQYSRWFAHYFIDVRVSLEANRHEIYMQLLEMIGSPVLEKHVLWETYRKARDLLNSESSLSSASERATLKTVALWLGRITLARNKPIKLRELSIKDLLIQGFDNKRLIVAIPFVCHLMACCKESTVFHPPNPWVVAILSLLVEFYHFGELRLNFKFEIEVLFSKLNIQLEATEPSTLLRTHTPPPPPQPDVPNRLDAELQRALSDLTSGRERFEPPVNDAFARMQAYQTEQAAREAQEAFLRRINDLVAELPEFLVFSQDYPIFTAPTLKRVVHHSIDRAIREIIQPVVERSVTIAGISSRDLVQKDFGMDGDAVKMRHAAHLMVGNLAGNLALVTCKEPLRTGMIANIRNMLSQNGFTEESMPDGMIQGCVNDNLDVACSVVRRAAMEKAAQDIDVNLHAQYAARRAHAANRPREPFFDNSSFGVGVSHSALPDPLRLRAGGLTPAQLRVYEDFGEPPRHVSSSINGDGASAYPDLMPADIKRGPSPFYPELEAVASPPMMTAQASIEKFHELVAEIEKLLPQIPAASLAAIPADDPIRVLVRRVVTSANQSTSREQTTLSIAQKAVQLLYKTPLSLGREVYTMMLQQLCELSRKVEKEVKSWLIYAEDSRKYNVPVTVTLIRAGFLPIPELDAQLAQMCLRSFAPEILDFVSNLVRACSLIEMPYVPRNSFAASLAALLRARELNHSTPFVDALLDDLRGPRSQDMVKELSNGSDKAPVDPKLQEQLAHHFLEWVRIYSQTRNAEAAFIPYITHIQKEGILNGEDVSSAFYRTAINCAVDIDMGRLDQLPPKFYGTDALAKLIVLIIKNYGDKSGSSAPRAVYYYNKILNIMSYSLVQRQLEESFSQRPWSRFFTSMLNELSSLEYTLPETYFGCLKSFANVLGIFQPTYAPRFAYGWFTAISHHQFMPKILSMTREEGWPEYHRCLMWLLRFLNPILQGEMSSSARYFYKATTRLLITIMKDFPEFLDEFYHTLSTAIPSHCIQLRNIVLAAFPASLGPLPSCYKRLEELAGEMQHFPTVRSDYISAMSAGNIKAAIDQHVRTGMPTQNAIVAELKNRIAVKSMNSDGSTIITWNHTLLHAVVFYLGTTAVQTRAQDTGIVDFEASAPEVGILCSLAFTLDAEGQYYMLCVIADQLRYPSAHTLFFISFMLHLYTISLDAETQSGIPERIARVLLERVLVQRPHPWGLLVTFVQLVEVEQYGLLKQPWARADVEIFAMFTKAQKAIVGQE